MLFDGHTLITILQNILTTYGPKLLSALLIFFIGKWIAKGFKKILNRMMTRSKVDPTVIPFILDLTYTALLLVVVVAALSALGIQTASLIAILGAAGLAVGLALQGSLSNFAAGVLILIFRPVRAGDYFEGAGVAGTVEKIQVFSTIAKTPDNKVVIIPNSKLFSDNIVNYSIKDIRRVDLLIGIGYEDSIDTAKEALADIMAKDTRILKDPAPTIGLMELADSSVNFAVRPWVKSGDYWTVHFDLLETIKKRFDTEGINIPYPQQDVHVYTVESQPVTA